MMNRSLWRAPPFHCEKKDPKMEPIPQFEQNQAISQLHEPIPYP